MTIDTNADTPLMKQYWDLKSQAFDALLFFRMGDFYELFGEDAVEASRILGITLTSRDRNKPNPTPMAGVPHHSVQSYIQKLLNAGKKVAIGEQMEDPDSVKGAGKIVRREIVRIFTPGIQFDAEGLEPNYLATALPASTDENWILVCLDASTGEVLVSDPIHSVLMASEFNRLSIRHFISLEDKSKSGSPIGEDQRDQGVLIEKLSANYLSLDRARSVIQNHYGIGNPETFIQTEAGILGLGILITYVLRTQQKERLAHLRLPRPMHQPKRMFLGPNTSEHLDLSELYPFINQTRSALGARELRRWMLAPLLCPDEIKERQTVVRELAQNSQSTPKLSSLLSEVYDLERIMGRVNTGLANPKDTLSLGQSLATLKPIREILKNSHAPILLQWHRRIEKLWDQIGDLSREIIQSQNESAPVSSKEGGIFQVGTSPELDHLLKLTTHGENWLIELESRERVQTGIPSLKVKYNRVFGYFIEVTQAHLKNVPPHYQRKQTMVGAERFFTEELKKFEEEILTASTKQRLLEQELFQVLLRKIETQTAPIMEAAQALGELDSVLALTCFANLPNWSFPEIDRSLDMEIIGGRHPMVDQFKRGQFVPNSVSLSPESQLMLLITGPNMGGKSTVMRQTALIVILGQMGGPVPAKSAKWGSVSSLFTRIGAHDAIAKGQSTFMVEMSELAYLLHRADSRSFIILDEIGRGTSTYDGISVAWATVEWLCSQIQARTLFATHYHELTRLVGSVPRLDNAHMAVESQNGTLRFLYELREGPANESFGIHVAQLAGLPREITDRAWKVLEELEKESEKDSDSAQNSGLKIDTQNIESAKILGKKSKTGKRHLAIKENQLSLF